MASHIDLKFGVKAKTYQSIKEDVGTVSAHVTKEPGSISISIQDLHLDNCVSFDDEDRSGSALSSPSSCADVEVPRQIRSWRCIMGGPRLWTLAPAPPPETAWDRGTLIPRRSVTVIYLHLNHSPPVAGPKSSTC